jgi:hypothetical protein
MYIHQWQSKVVLSLPCFYIYILYIIELVLVLDVADNTAG